MAMAAEQFVFTVDKNQRKEKRRKRKRPSGSDLCFCGQPVYSLVPVLGHAGNL